ncbi:MAG: hypothetical protein IJB40_07450 [Alistipes sp.]|nr:hypothetical protein [Alistipes sp.]
MRLRNIFILLFAALTFGCGQSKHIRQSLDRASSIMKEHPDSARAILANMERSALKSRALRARHALLYSQAMDKCYVDTDNDSLTSVALDYYKSHGTDHEKALAYYYNGIVVLNKNGETEQIIGNMVAAQHYAENTDDTYLKGLISFIVGKQYYNQLSFEEALDNFDKAATYFEEINHRRNLMLSLQYKGICQNVLEMYDEAIATHSKNKELALELKDTSVLLHNIQITVSAKHRKEGNKSNKKELINELLEASNKYNNGIIYSDYYPLLSSLYYDIKDYDSAKYYVLEEYHKNRISQADIGKIYRLGMIEYAMNNKDEAYLKLKEYINLKDSLNTEKQKSLVQSLEQKYKAKYLKESLEQLQKQHRMTNTIYALSVILVLIAGVFTFRRYRHAAKERARKIEELEQYVEQGNSKYTELQEKYNTIAKEIERLDKNKSQQSSRVLDVLKNRIESLHKLSDLAATYGVTNTSKFYNKFQEHIRLSNNKNQELMADVITIADLLNNGVITHLRKCHPSLTDYELCYCAFITLGFGTESIRLLFNHSNINSIYTTRAKIRNKLGISNTLGVSLEGYIEEMCEKLKSAEIEGGGI